MNPHEVYPHWILNPARLPIPPLRLSGFGKDYDSVMFVTSAIYRLGHVLGSYRLLKLIGPPRIRTVSEWASVIQNQWCQEF